MDEENQINDKLKIMKFSFLPFFSSLDHDFVLTDSFYFLFSDKSDGLIWNIEELPEAYIA